MERHYAPCVYAWLVKHRRFTHIEELAILSVGTSATSAGVRCGLKMSHLRCSFCNRSMDEVNRLISSREEGRAYICADCIEVCSKILQEPSDAPYYDTPSQSALRLRTAAPSRFRMWMNRTFKLRPPS
jgi:hypothetical protein